MIWDQRFYHLKTPKPRENPPNNILFKSYKQFIVVRVRFCRKWVISLEKSFSKFSKIYNFEVLELFNCSLVILIQSPMCTSIDKLTKWLTYFWICYSRNEFSYIITNNIIWFYPTVSEIFTAHYAIGSNTILCTLSNSSNKLICGERLEIENPYQNWNHNQSLFPFYHRQFSNSIFDRHDCDLIGEFTWSLFDAYDVITSSIGILELGYKSMNISL